MADSTTPIQQVIAGTGAAAQVNENFDAASPAMLYSRRAATTTGLTWGYVGGRWGGAAVANGTVTLTANASNYIVAELATGAVSASTSTTNWLNTADYARLYKSIAGPSTVTSYEDHRAGPGGVFGQGSGGSTVEQVQCLPIACSDETTALTAGAAKVTFRMPYAMTLAAVRASVTTAPTGSVLTVDINEGGASILSAKLTIDAGEKTSVTAATPAVITDSALADDAEITIDIDGVGSTVAGAGLKVYLIGTLT
jgi:hypothetical protein